MTHRPSRAEARSRDDGGEHPLSPGFAVLGTACGLRDRSWLNQAEPMHTTSDIHDGLNERVRGRDGGGIGTMQGLAHHPGLIGKIGDRLNLSKLA